MTEPVRRSRFWLVCVPIVCLVAGLLFATAREVSAGDELRRGDTTRLSDLVRAAQSDLDGVTAEHDGLATRVEELQDTAGYSDSDVAAVLDQVRALEGEAGRSEVIGPGVTVTMTDASRDSDGNYPAGARPDDLVVHQQDVQSVLNALWAGGATAVGMQDQRIVSTSAPRCIGNTLLLHGRTYSPPYVMTALGDPARLTAALDAEPGVRLFKQYAVRYGLGYTQSTSDSLTVPAFDGQMRTKFAR
ncbi:Membrane protein [Rhodococcus sp. RD6.2]|jgi:uncharacterized protein YlxW (UPF0749 family)|uniref:DUF881 domain-containing protein n=1 Tax=Rhodococcus sp. RD6.2 TaxID=260936 RepID=UPI00063BB9EE|nr:DUF881 domain-containing protein [Rhodococcus sp. RD6.2]CRK53864.1 Membrane protein [Rhodococcus sp. RD6.2]